jgi:hypothetical protein
MCFSSPSTPAPEPPPPPPTVNDAEVQSAKDNERKRRVAAAGRTSTILTGGEGVTTAERTQGKQVLGA